MITFLFWNLNRKPLAHRVAKLATSRAVDIVILAECVIDPEEMSGALRQMTGRQYVLPYSQCEKIMIYCGFAEDRLKTEADADRFTLRRLTLPDADEILLVAAHLQCKLYDSNESQVYEFVRLADEIRRVEQEIGHSRTVLVGDLNANPFEPGVVSARGLHGVMTRQRAVRRQRTVQGKAYPFFYNPMWGRLGDETKGPPGTYHNNPGGHVNFFWNTFDQVLVRPDLLSAFRYEDLDVLTDDGESPLISTRGTPDAVVASDHLPIVFKLHL